MVFILYIIQDSGTVYGKHYAQKDARLILLEIEYIFLGKNNR